MFQFLLFLIIVCLSLNEGRNVPRVIREIVEVNATAIDDKNVTSKANDAPEISEIQSDLIAPASGPKPLQAKYTIRIMPKLRDGVPQVQEIRIMPPKSDKTLAFFKPLMVLKQNVTKPMIENIEIDIPEKGKKYSAKPSVEVIEGDHREMLEVSKGQAVVENAEQRSQDHPAGIGTQDSTEQPTSQNTTQYSTPQNATKSSQTATQPSTSQNATQSSASQNATQAVIPQNETKPLTSQDAPVKQSSQNAAVIANTRVSQPQAPATAPSVNAPSTSAASNSVAQPCTDDGRCVVYPENRCAEPWLVTNCRLKCKLCSK